MAVSTAASPAVTVRRFISMATNVGTCNDRLLSPRFPTGLPISCAPRVPSAMSNRTAQVPADGDMGLAEAAVLRDGS